MWQRSLLEIVRVRGALLPTTVAPMIFLLGTTGQFGRLADLSGLPDDVLPRLDPAALLPAGRGLRRRRGRREPRPRHRAGLVRPAADLAGAAPAAAGRAGARGDDARGRPDDRDPDDGPRARQRAQRRHRRADRALRRRGLVLHDRVALGLVRWRCAPRTQQVGPLIQNGVFLAVFLSTAYTPLGLLGGWLGALAPYNPVTYVLEMARQATVDGHRAELGAHLARPALADRHDALLRRDRAAPAAAHGATDQAKLMGPLGAFFCRARTGVLTVRCTSAAAVGELRVLKRSR